MPRPKRKRQAADATSPEPRLTIEIKNSRPVDLSALVEMFSGLNNGYNKYVSEHESFELNKETRLFVREVRKGSQIYELVQLAPLAIPFIENMNSIIEFTGHLKKAFDYLLGKAGEKPEVDSNDLRNIAKIVEPIVKDNGAQLNLTATHQTNHIHYHINYVEGNAVQNRVSQEIGLLKEPGISGKEKVVFYWYVAKDDLNSQSGDRGIIESITPKPLKVLFDDSKIKDKMLNVESNPFHLAYVVDANIETIEGRPAAYKIVALHETFPKP